MDADKEQQYIDANLVLSRRLTGAEQTIKDLKHEITKLTLQIELDAGIVRDLNEQIRNFKVQNKEK
jgi:hypothetical protein